MKRINLLAVFAAIIVIIAVVIASIFIFGGNNTDDTNELLDCETVSQVKEYIEKNNIDAYGFETNYCYINSIEILGQEANIEFSFKEEKTTNIAVYYTLFLHEVDEDEVEDEVEGGTHYEFTEKDKEEFNEKFDVIKKEFEKKLSCELTQYDLIPTQDDVEIKDDDELFYQGLLIKEYSVRDSSGQLWLLRYEASYGMANATLVKVYDETEYEGFIPSADLAK